MILPRTKGKGMVNSPTLLNLLGYNNGSVTKVAVSINEDESELDYEKIKELIKEEMVNAISTMSTLHADTPEYQMAANNLKVLSDILNSLEKGSSEKDKIKLQIIEAQNKRQDGYSQTMLKMGGIVTYGIILAFWIGLERNSTVPQRLVNGMSQLVRPSI
jgi:hypothetical protein